MGLSSGPRAQLRELTAQQKANQKEIKGRVRNQVSSLTYLAKSVSESSTKEKHASPVFHPLQLPWDCTSKRYDILNSPSSPTYLRRSAYKNGFYDLLSLLSTAARGRQQYTLSKRIILFSDTDMHIALIVTLLVFIYLSALQII